MADRTPEEVALIDKIKRAREHVFTVGYPPPIMRAIDRRLGDYLSREDDLNYYGREVLDLPEAVLALPGAEMAGDLRNTPDATLRPRYDARLNDDDLWFVWDRIGTRQVGHATADQDEAEGFARGLNELMAYNADQAPVPATGGPGEVERLRAENLRLREHALKILRERDGAILVRDGLIKERATKTQAPATPDTGQREYTGTEWGLRQAGGWVAHMHDRPDAEETQKLHPDAVLVCRYVGQWSELEPSAAQAPAASEDVRADRHDPR